MDWGSRIDSRRWRGWRGGLGHAGRARPGRPPSVWWAAVIVGLLATLPLHAPAADGGSAVLPGKAAGPVTVLPSVAAAGDTIAVLIQGGPAQAGGRVRIRLSRDGLSVVLDATYAPPAAGSLAGSATATLPGASDGSGGPSAAPAPQLAPGDYEVRAEFEQPPRTFRVAQPLEITPPGTTEVHLTSSAPTSTEDLRSGYFRASAWAPWQSARRERVVSLDLLGSGFLTGPLVGDNTLTINGVRQLAVRWLDCTEGAADLATAAAAAPVASAATAAAQDTSAATAAAQAPGGDSATASATLAQDRTTNLLVLPCRDYPADRGTAAAGRPVESACAAPLADMASTTVPVRGVVAEVLGRGRLHLCHVPVPAGGELRLAVGWGDRSSSEVVRFRVYPLGRIEVTLLAGAVALVLALVPLALLGLLTRHYRIDEQTYRLRLLFLDPETDTYSLSKLQFYLWTIAALFGYAYLFISRVWVQWDVWPDVPGSLPGILAIAGGTSVLSQVVTGARGSKGAGSVEPGFTDFITSGGVVATDRVQMLLWTLFGVGGFVLSVAQQYPGTMATLPVIPEHLMYLMGLSSAGYLGGKLARQPGPVISELIVAPADADDVLARQAVVADLILPDPEEAMATARAARATLAPPQGPAASAALDALATALTACSAAQSAGSYDGLLEQLAVQRALAEARAVDAANAFATAAAGANPAAAADAGLAQRAAAILQDLAADITQAIASAAAASVDRLQADQAFAPIPRVITLRGSNLSPSAQFAIDGAALAFHLLVGPEDKHVPEVLAREDNNASYARVLRLTIDPARLEATDRSRLRTWFGAPGAHTFTITNPDGQLADASFAIPPNPAPVQGGKA